MDVPGEALERGRGLRKRPLALAFAGALTALLLYLYAPLPAPRVGPPTGEDCIALHFYSNGYHGDISVPAALFPADHPLRRLFPEAQEFLIGWGDEAFYRSDGTDLWLGLAALAPPSPSTLHVSYNAPYAAAYLGPNADTPVAVSRAGAAALVAYLDRALALDDEGAPIVLGPGKVVGRSAFLRARGSFHLFNVCNQWMARALRAAGVNVNARAAWLAGPLVTQVRRQGRAACPS